MNPTDKENEIALSQLMDGEWHGLNSTQGVADLCADAKRHGKWARYHIIRDVIKNEPVSVDVDLAASICKAIADEPAYSNIAVFNGAVDGARNVDRREATPQTASASVANNTAAAGQQDGDEPHWVNTGVAGLAVAASVALFTVVGLNLIQQQEQPSSVLAQSFVAAGGNASAVVAVPSVAGAPPPPQNQFSPYAPAEQGSLPVVDFVANTGPFWMSSESYTRVNGEQRLNMLLSHHIENSPTAGREGLLPYSRLVGYEESNQGR